jgi:hypothetical protein
MRFVLISLLTVAPPTAAQSPAQRAGFVTVLGQDTVALESFARTPGRIEGDIVVRVPSTVRFRYLVERTADRGFAKSVLETIPLGSTDILARKVTLVAERDSVRITVDSSGTRRRGTRPLAAGAVPLFLTGFNESFGLYGSVGLYEFFLSEARLEGHDTLTVPSLAIATGRTTTRRFRQPSPRVVDVDFFKIAWTHLTTDGSTRILSVDARETTEKTESRRTEYVDIGRAAKSFAARDRSGTGIGVASPNEIVMAPLGGGRVRIAYGSPRRRGRDVLGSVVPYGQIWRTGANAATELALDRDVTIGGASVPAGAYTLWTFPRPDGVDLVINRQTGQWGTEYHQERDLARVPMRTTTARERRENFAITLDGAERARELHIAWDTFVWSVPIVAK